MKLKVGDRIKFVGITPRKYIGYMGVIIEVRPPEREYSYRIQLDGCFPFPVLDWEIEKVPIKNQQLLFDFAK